MQSKGEYNMGEKVSQGAWVEIHRIVLKKGERAPQVPDDTKDVPLEMRAKGVLVEDAEMGKEATIVTRSGRQLTGTLMEINPAYDHQFGRPILELLAIGDEVRSILNKWREK
jgi:hypothetical protein